MAVILYRQRTLVVPRGFAIWLLFLVWMLAGVFVVRAIAPGTVPGVGIGRSAASWCGPAGTSPSPSRCSTSSTPPGRCPPSGSSACWRWMFVVTTGFGVLAVLVPTLEFKSAMELVLPRA